MTNGTSYRETCVAPCISHVQSADDPKLLPFREEIRESEGRQPRHFIAEGRILIETISRGGCEFEAILISDLYSQQLESQLASIRTREWIIVPTALLHNVCGFRFHGGMLGLGPRISAPTLFSIIGERSHPCGVVVGSLVNNQDNLGVITRSAQAFGFSAVLVTEGAGDPHSRRCLRQSMGATLLTPVLKTSRLKEELLFLQDRGFTVIGASIGPTAQVFQNMKKPARFALVLGNEAFGIPDEILGICDCLAAIPMVPSQDSVNVSVAGAILMQYFSAPLLAQ